jgi:hypothetical protein
MVAVLGAAGLPARGQAITDASNIAEWAINPFSGTSNNLPVGGIADGSPGLGIEEGRLIATDQGDSFDNGLVLFLTNGASTSVYAPAMVTLTPTTAIGDVTNVVGIDTQVRYDALDISGSGTLRTFITLTNNGPTAANLTAALATNLGSNGNTFIVDTSSGDTTFTTADRWLITADGTTPDPDVTNTFVFFGENALVTTSSVSQTVFENFGTEGVLANFTLTLGAGETRSLLLYNQIHGTPAEAQAAVGVFNTPFPTGALVAGLSAAQLATVVNWGPGPPPVEIIPEPSSLVLSLLGVGGLGVWSARRSRRAAR